MKEDKARTPGGMLTICKWIRPERPQTLRWCDGRASCQPPGRCAHQGRRRARECRDAVFEAVALGPAGRKRRDTVEPVQGLNGALFIDRENSPVHWVELETRPGVG